MTTNEILDINIVDTDEDWFRYHSYSYDSRGNLVLHLFDKVKSVGDDETDELFEAADTKRFPVDTRPVACLFCNEKMYYDDHQLHEDEVTLDISSLGSVRSSGRFYAHTKCLPLQLKEEA